MSQNRRGLVGVLFAGGLSMAYWSAAHNPRNSLTRTIRQFYESSLTGRDFTLVGLAAVFGAIAVGCAVVLLWEIVQVIRASPSARHNIAPRLARGSARAVTWCGREGGRYKRRTWDGTDSARAICSGRLRGRPILQMNTVPPAEPGG